MCDFAVGLSRQLYGLTIASERPRHRMFEQWHPLGPIGIITAFNFPVAVWAWNAAIAAVCGDTMVWKPSPRDAADGDRRAADRRPSVAAATRLPGRLQPRASATATTSASAMIADPRAAADLGHRQLPDGPARRRGRRPRGWAGRCSSSAATTRSSSRRTPTSTWPCAPSLFARRRHRRPALHDARGG